MTTHPETADIFLVRHAPVVKKPGHVPPSDPPIIDQPYALETITSMLPSDAEWHVSPLHRTRQTAALLMPHLDPAAIHEDSRLAEMEFGAWADRPVSDVWNEIKDGPLHNWSFVTADRTPPDGGSFIDLVTQVRGWMDDLAASFTPTPRIVVTHGGVIRAAISVALAAQPEHAVGIPVPHFGVARLCLMDPARATAAGGNWLFAGLFAGLHAGLSDPLAVPDQSGA